MTHFPCNKPDRAAPCVPRQTAWQLTIAAVALLPAAGLLAQQSGVAHPEALGDPIVTHSPVASETQTSVATTTDRTVTTYQTPAAPAVLLERRDAPVTTYAPYAPAAANGSAPIVVVAAPATVVSTPTPAPQPRTLPAISSTHGDDDMISDASAAAMGDSPMPRVHDPLVSAADSGLVTRVPSSRYELPEGSILRVILQQRLSTEATRVGTPFDAQLSADVIREGVVLLPARSVVSGRVTAVHSGTRLHGSASLHLQPESITLPDGTVMKLTAQIVDTDLYRTVHITQEGTIKHSDNLKETFSALGLVTGTAAVAGAMLGGPAGALVGAGIGAGVGTVVVLRQDQQQVLAEGTGLMLALTRPLNVRPGLERTGNGR